MAMDVHAPSTFYSPMNDELSRDAVASAQTIEMKEGAKSLEARGVPDQSVSERY